MRARRTGRISTTTLLAVMVALTLPMGSIHAAIPTSQMWSIGPEGVDGIRHVTSETREFYGIPGDPAGSSAVVVIERTSPLERTYFAVWDSAGTAPEPGTSGSIVAGQSGAGVSMLCAFTGTYVVHEAEYAADSTTTKLAVDLHGNCSGEKFDYAMRFASTFPVKAFMLDTIRLNAGEAQVDAWEPAQRVTVTSNGLAPIEFGSAALIGTNADDFRVTANSCTRRIIEPGRSCAIDLRFVPLTPGKKAARVRFTTNGLATSYTFDVVGHASAATSTTVVGSIKPVIWPEQPTGSYTVRPATTQGFVTLHDQETGKFASGGLPGGGASVTFAWPEDNNDRLAAGRHHLELLYQGADDYLPSRSGWVVADILAPTTTTLVSTPDPVRAGEPQSITAAVATGSGSGNPGTPFVGVLKVVDTYTGTSLGTHDITHTDREFTIRTSLTSTGVHRLKATFTASSGSLFGPSTATFDQDVVADTKVNASGFGVTPTTFYPVVDTYRDLLEVVGKPAETLTVKIQVFNDTTGKIVRSVDLGSTSAAYRWEWNGRTSSGTLVTAGKYRIVQTLKDGAGNIVKNTSYVTLSHKKLVKKTVTATRVGEKYSHTGVSGGTVSTTKSSYATGVLADSGSGWAAIGYTFDAPVYTVFHSVRFTVYGKSPNSTQGIIALHNPALGSALNLNAYEQVKIVGPAYDDWSTTGNAAHVTHSDGQSRGLVYVEAGASASRFDIQKVSMTFVYSVLE